jgi:hypothetical protein
MGWKDLWSIFNSQSILYRSFSNNEKSLVSYEGWLCLKPSLRFRPVCIWSIRFNHTWKLRALLCSRLFCSTQFFFAIPILESIKPITTQFQDMVWRTDSIVSPYLKRFVLMWWQLHFHDLGFSIGVKLVDAFELSHNDFLNSLLILVNKVRKMLNHMSYFHVPECFQTTSWYNFKTKKY